MFEILEVFRRGRREGEVFFNTLFEKCKYSAGSFWFVLKYRVQESIIVVGAERFQFVTYIEETCFLIYLPFVLYSMKWKLWKFDIVVLKLWILSFHTKCLFVFEVTK